MMMMMMMMIHLCYDVYILELIRSVNLHATSSLSKRCLTEECVPMLLLSKNVSVFQLTS